MQPELRSMMLAANHTAGKRLWLAMVEAHGLARDALRSNYVVRISEVCTTQRGRQSHMVRLKHIENLLKIADSNRVGGEFVFKKGSKLQRILDCILVNFFRGTYCCALYIIYIRSEI